MSENPDEEVDMQPMQSEDEQDVEDSGSTSGGSTGQSPRGSVGSADSGGSTGQSPRGSTGSAGSGGPSGSAGSEGPSGSAGQSPRGSAGSAGQSPRGSAGSAGQSPRGSAGSAGPGGPAGSGGQSEMSPDDASKELENLFANCSLSPKALTKPIWNRNTSTPQGPFQDPYPRNNYSPDGSWILAGQDPSRRPRPVFDLSPIRGAIPNLNETFDAPPRGPPINNATFNAGPAPRNNATFNAGPAPPPPNNPRNSMNDPERDSFRYRDVSAYLGMGSTPTGPPLRPLYIPDPGSNTPDSFEMNERLQRLRGEEVSQPPPDNNPINPNALPPEDDFLSLVDKYTNEILWDFANQMDKTLPPIIEEKVNEFVDKFITPESISTVLDITLPKMLDKALETLTFNAVEQLLKQVLGEATVEVVLPLMALGRVTCGKHCDCLAEDCYKDFGPGDNPCAEFSLPQPTINRKFPPLLNKAPGDPRQLDIPLPPNVAIGPRPRSASRGRRPKGRRYDYDDEDEDGEDQICPCMEGRR